MDACQFFRFASATTPAQALGSSEKSGGGDGETTSLVIDTDVTATPDAVAEATRKEEEVEEDENALNDFAIQRMMPKRIHSNTATGRLLFKAAASRTSAGRRKPKTSSKSSKSAYS